VLGWLFCHWLTHKCWGWFDYKLRVIKTATNTLQQRVHRSHNFKLSKLSPVVKWHDDSSRCFQVSSDTPLLRCACVSSSSGFLAAIDYCHASHHCVQVDIRYFPGWFKVTQTACQTAAISNTNDLFLPMNHVTMITVCAVRLWISQEGRMLFWVSYPLACWDKSGWSSQLRATISWA